MENKQIILPVRARHFKNNNYGSNFNCPIATAAKEFFNAAFVSEGVDNIDIFINENEINAYSHKLYEFQAFEKDFEQAGQTDFDETIIFELELMPYGKQRNF